MRIRIPSIKQYFPMLVLCLMTCCYDLIISVFGLSLYVMIALGVIALWFVFEKVNINRISMISLLMLGMLFFIVYRNANFERLFFSYQIIEYVIMMLLCCAVFDDEGWISSYFNILIALYVFYAVMTIWCASSPDFYYSAVLPFFPENSGRLSNWYQQGCNAGFTSHYSTNGMFMANAFIITFCSFFVAKKNQMKAFKILSVLFLVALLLTGKRGPLIFSVAAIYIALYQYMSNKPRKRIVQLFGVTLMIVCVGTIIISLFPELSIGLSRLLDVGESEDITNGRSLFWEYAFILFADNPIIGVGWKQYSKTMQEYTHYDKAADVHNIYIQLLCETGIIGFVIFVAFFVFMFVTAMKTLRYIRFNSEKFSYKDQYYMVLSVALQSYFLLYGFTGNPLYDAMVFIPYFLACAIALHYKRKIRRISYE